MSNRKGEESPELAYLRKLLAKSGLPNVQADLPLAEMRTELARRLKLRHGQDEQSSFEAFDIALSLLVEFEREI